jgi:hypothetical protein
VSVQQVAVVARGYSPGGRRGRGVVAGSRVRRFRTMTATFLPGRAGFSGPRGVRCPAAGVAGAGDLRRALSRKRVELRLVGDTARWDTPDEMATRSDEQGIREGFLSARSGTAGAAVLSCGGCKVILDGGV